MAANAPSVYQGCFCQQRPDAVDINPESRRLRGRQPGTRAPAQSSRKPSGWPPGNRVRRKVSPCGSRYGQEW